MTIQTDDLVADVAAYYSGKLAAHGATPKGVDWNGPESQQLRFEQLCRIIDGEEGFSVTDFGCGYGALYDMLAARGAAFSYTGIDVSQTMIAAAQERIGAVDNARFIATARIEAMSDFTLASGVFNLRVGRSDQEWKAYMIETLDMLVEKSRRGVAFNCLTTYSDADRMRPDLFYADPVELFTICKERYSRHVALLHDYGLYEFTLLVRKTLA